ncbi:MAG: hypothetical protein JRH15_11840, partial [Deltaproteobacteria bacterium]|nr:hypothetical protein [Deltaproteobacteria bacterium]
ARQGSNGSPGGDKLNKKQLRQRRSHIIAERARLLKPLERQMAESEDKIDHNEKKIGELNQEMLAVSQAGGGANIAKISKEIHRYQEEIDAQFETLERLSLAHEEKSVEFDKQLETLDKAGH